MSEADAVKKFLVVLSDRPHTGRGTRGMSLVWFLRTFVGAGGVQTVTPHELLDRRSRKADIAFVGLPTRVGGDHLARLSCRQLVLFDYHDSPEACPEYTDLEFLRGLTHTYLKCCVESTWTNRWQWGCLPLRRYGKLTREVFLHKARQSLRRRDTPKTHDVGFLGYPTILNKIHSNGQRTELRQRINWMLELATTELSKPGSSLNFWGGLVLTPAWRSLLSANLEALAPVIFADRRIGFANYFRQMRRCRVVLAPAGNARWTYRHYEAAYAGATLVSTDLSNANLLVPLCEQNMRMVPDDEDLMPHLRRDLMVDDAQREEAAENSIRHLETFYRYGSFHRSRPLPYEHFLAQLDRSALAPVGTPAIAGAA